jgi:hypothetical protein
MSTKAALASCFMVALESASAPGELCYLSGNYDPNVPEEVHGYCRHPTARSVHTATAFTSREMAQRVLDDARAACEKDPVLSYARDRMAKAKIIPYNPRVQVHTFR